MSDDDLESVSNAGEWEALERDLGVVNDSAPTSACGCGDENHEPELIKDGAASPISDAWDDLEHEPQVLDVLIIGGGPAGLAAAARIREKAPAAMFTDEEHRRWSWIRKHGKRVPLKKVKTGEVIPAKVEHESEYSMAVLDATDNDWLGTWKDRFATFDIRHLRSPMIWHVDPRDRDALLSHARYEGTKNDMIEIKGCVGKEKSKFQQKKAKFNGNT